MDPHKSLFRKVEKALQAIQRSSDATSTIAETASAVIDNFQGELGVRGGRLYERRDGGYELTRVFGGSIAAPGIFVPDAYPPVQQVIDEGIVLLDLTAPGVDPEFERRLDRRRMPWSSRYSSRAWSGVIVRARTRSASSVSS